MAEKVSEINEIIDSVIFVGCDLKRYTEFSIIRKEDTPLKNIKSYDYVIYWMEELWIGNKI